MTDQKTNHASTESHLNVGLADKLDTMSDPHEAVLNLIDEMKEFGLLSSTRSIGFVEVNGKKAQVQICIDAYEDDWIHVG